MLKGPNWTVPPSILTYYSGSTPPMDIGVSSVPLRSDNSILARFFGEINLEQVCQLLPRSHTLVFIQPLSNL